VILNRAPPGSTIDAIIRFIIKARLRWVLQSSYITFEVT